MAAKYQSTKETVNFARICRLMIDVVPDVFRELLHSRLPTSGLGPVLGNQKGQIFSLLNNQQKKILFPKGGVFAGSLQDLDTSLIYILLRNLGNIPPHKNGWGRVPDVADRSLSANIDRLRVQRNEAYAHANTASISDGDFKIRWADIRKSVEDIENTVLTSMAFVAKVDSILSMRIDPQTEQNFIVLVQKLEGEIGDIKVQQDTMKTDVEDVKGEIGDIKVQQDTMKTDVEGVKGAVSDVTALHNTTTRDVGEIKGAVSDVTARLDMTVVEIKGAVSDVTARHDTTARDVDEIKGAVSDVTARHDTTARDVDDIKGAVSDVTARHDTTARDVDEIKGEIGDIKVQQDTMKTDVEGVKGEIGDIKVQQDTMKTDVEGVKGAVSDVTGRLDMTVDEIKGAVSDVTARLDMTVDEIKGAVSDVTARHDMTARDVDEIKGAVSDVTARHNTTARDVDEIKGAVSDVTARHDTTARDVDEIKAEVSDVKNRQDTIAKDVDTLKERNSKLTAMIETTKIKIKRDRLNYQFIATKNFHEAQKKLKNRMVIIKGNTGDGKSSIAIELLRFLCCDEEGQQKQPLELHDIKDVDLVAPKSGLVIYFDDIFGKNVVCKGDVDEWEKREECILSKLCESEKSEGNILVMTIRSEILNSLDSSFSKNIFTEENIVDLSENKDEEEKRKLLRLYMPLVKFDKWTDDEEKEIFKLCPDIGFPQCCRLFRDTPTLQAERINFFRRPFHFVKSCLDKLKDGKFYGLLYLFLNGGKVIENDLDPSNENVDKTLLEAAFAVDVVKVDPTNELVYNKGRKAEFVKESLESLLGSLVKKEGGFYPCYKFNHDSIEETVALLYGEKTPIGYIQNCPSKLFSYITTTKNTPNRIVISSDDQTNAMYKRTVKEMKECKSVDPKRYRCSSVWNYLVKLDVWTDCQFLQGFVTYLSDQKVDNSLCHEIKHDLFNQACSTGSAECALFLLSKDVKPDKKTPFRVVKGGSVQLLTELLKCKVITPTARADWSRSSNIHYSRDINVLHEACLFEREDMVQILCDTYPDLVHETDQYRQSTLHFVARTGNCGIFQTVERLILKSLYRDKVQDKCEIEDGHVVHRSCVCGQYMSQLVDWEGYTILHVSCKMGHRELSLELCKLYPALTTAVDNRGYNCLHHIAIGTSDVDMFTECERHVKQYVETTGGKYDITTILTNDGKSVLDLAKEQTERERKWRKLDNNPLYDHHNMM
ncbi:uncharacterized protein LOC117314740 [Pecten maximus]|uniref:uncharacterized protein LOC117314740 n=1 Tax=Pecten maximus TaxID=6579 RepID=UPI001458C350|nr:uncharacterized protein LOC117314740 [Pecten maximus]